MLTLEQDPWVRPYRIVLNKLRGGASPLTEILDPQFVERIVATLFPRGEGATMPTPENEPEWDEDELGITRGELQSTIRRIKSRKAPGPDGVHRKA